MKRIRRQNFRMSNRCLPSSLCCLLLSFLLWTRERKTRRNASVTSKFTFDDGIAMMIPYYKWHSILCPDVMLREWERPLQQHQWHKKRNNKSMIESTRPTNIQASKLGHDIMSVAVVVSKTSREQTNIIKLHTFKFCFWFCMYYCHHITIERDIMYTWNSFITERLV